MSETICTLGYHSHRGWVIRPQIFLLYDKILMNRESYESAVARGESKESTFAHIVSELLKEYRQKGLIELEDYEVPITTEDKELVDQAVEHWLRTLPEEVSELLQAIYTTQADVWEGRLLYLSPGEPAYAKMANEIDTFRQWVSRVKQQEFIVADKEILIHYLQQVVFTNKIVSGAGTPVFDWPSNMKLRAWMLSTLPLPETQRKLELQHLEHGTRIRTLNALVEVIVEDQAILDDKQVAEFLERRTEMKDVRRQVDAMNRTLWDFVRHQAEQGHLDAVDMFLSTLKLQVDKLKRDLKSIELEKTISARKKLVTSAAGLVTGAASAAASLFVPIVPGLAKTVVDKALEKSVSKLGDKLVERKYPELMWAAIYQDAYAGSLTKRTSLTVRLDSFHDQHAPEYGERDVCDILGISKAQLYHYEEQGLLLPALRDRWNRRIYTPAHLERLMQLVLSPD